jgi:hypothetical protein
MAATMTMAITETASAIETSTQAMFVERRRGVRYQFTATVEVVDLKSQTRMQARTSDLSKGGCYVDTTSPFPVGTTVKVRLTKDNRCFEAKAKVVYSLVGMGMGLAFTSAEKDQIEVLKRWVGELSGELQPELIAAEPVKPAAATKDSSNGQSFVLGALVLELMRQGVLSNEKGKAMLEQIL